MITKKNMATTTNTPTHWYTFIAFLLSTTQGSCGVKSKYDLLSQKRIFATFHRIS
jgi:hypothetical protein